MSTYVDKNGNWRVDDRDEKPLSIVEQCWRYQAQEEAENRKKLSQIITERYASRGPSFIDGGFMNGHR